MLKLFTGLGIPYLKIGLIVLAVTLLWGHGYYTAYQYWDNWYDKEVQHQKDVNKRAYDRGLEDAKRLEQEDKKDEDTLKQNEQESQNDPNRDTPALSLDSVQRLQRL